MPLNGIAPVSGFTIRAWVQRHVLKRTVWIILLWAGINTGPWQWQSQPESGLQWIHWLRTGAPLLVLMAGSPLLLSRPPVMSGPLRFWFFYGIIGSIGCLFSPHPLHALYWAANYLAVFSGTALFFHRTSLKNARDLNYLNWAITFGILILMVFVARDALFVSRGGHLTAYGVVNRVGDVGGVIISRASGFARFAAIPAVTGFVLFWSDDRRRKLLGTCIFVPSALLIWFLQSRGAIFGLAFAMCFVTIFLSRRSRWIGILGATLCLLMMWTGEGEQRWLDYVYNHVSRGQAVDELVSMTGRDRAWRNAWPEIREHPLFGQGFQADRLTIGEHVHNTYMYALMTAGFLGAGLFILGLAWAWLLFWQAWQNNWGRKTGQHLHLIQVGGVLAFFTVRSIPEVSGAMYSIDQFLMVPAIAYLTILSKVAGRRR